MSIRPYRDIQRRKTRKIFVGNVPVGGDAPITVQTMTNTPTPDVKATVEQIRRCAEAGADIVRVSCPAEDSPKALKDHNPPVRVPLVPDLHFPYKPPTQHARHGR